MCEIKYQQWEDFMNVQDEPWFSAEVCKSIGQAV